jgi:CheY-like chemotaxis protein
LEPRTLALVSDLIFATKIRSTAESLGLSVQVVRTPAAYQEALCAGGITQVILDLNLEGADPLEALRVALSAPQKPRVIAYLSHVQVALAEKARSTGADLVLPRSVFVSHLTKLLSGKEL